MPDRKIISPSCRKHWTPSTEIDLVHAYALYLFPFATVFVQRTPVAVDKCLGEKNELRQSKTEETDFVDLINLSQRVKPLESEAQ